MNIGDEERKHFEDPDQNSFFLFPLNLKLSNKPIVFRVFKIFY